MFEKLTNLFKKIMKKENEKETSKDTAKERLHLVLMQDRANVSSDFLELMKQEIIDVIKKYIDIDEDAIDVKLTNKTNEDGTIGAPALYANIPIATLKKSNFSNAPEKADNTNIERQEDSSITNKENNSLASENNKEIKENIVNLDIKTDEIKENNLNDEKIKPNAPEKDEKKV